MLVLLSLSAALAQGVDTLTDTAAPREVYKPVTEVDFDTVKVGGEIVRPDGQMLGEYALPIHQPLIRVRASFDDVMQASVDEVK